MKLRNKMVILTTLTPSFILIAVGLYINFNYIKLQDERFITKMDSTIAFANGVFTDSIWNYEFEPIQEQVKAFMQDEDMISMKVYGFNKQELASEKRKGWEKEKVENIIEKKGEIIKEGEKIGGFEINFTKKYLKQNTVKIIYSFAIAIFIVVCIIGSSTYIFISILMKPIDRIFKYTENLSKGDFSKEITNISNDEIGLISKALNDTVRKLREVLKEIKDGEELIIMSSNDMSSGNENLAKKSGEQYSAVEKASSTIDEIGLIIKENTAKTKEANSMTNRVSTSITQTGEYSNMLKKSMDKIKTSSMKIENIIEVIDEISFQTNLLSLNAAVEAARAGESGRGFAVVAIEIRNLANRSSKAAKEIKDIIKNSQNNVAEGVNLVDETMKNVERVVDEIKYVEKMIDGIAKSAENQEIGVEIVRETIKDVDKITKHNVDLAEETSVITMSLREKAQNLRDLFDFFVLEKKKKNENNEEKLEEA